MDEDRCFDVKALAAYSGLSPSTLRRYMDDPQNPLPHHHVCVGGKDRGRVLIRKSEFDAWLDAFPGRGPKRQPARAETTREWVRRLAK